MRKLLTTFLLLLAPAVAAQVPRVVTTATDPDGQACTVQTPPFIVVYSTGSTMEHFTCQSSVWTEILAGTGDMAKATYDTDSDNTVDALEAVTAMPGTPATGDVVIVTDDGTAGDCDSAGGTAISLCRYNGSAWEAVGDGGGGASAFNDLSDVTLTTPATGATLIKSAGDWVDGQLDLADTDAVTGVLPDGNVADDLTINTTSAARFNSTVDVDGALATASLPVFDVLHPDYNAACNGVADDQPEIQLAIDAAEAAGGGIVQLPNTTCCINSALHVDGARITIQAAGQRGRLKACAAITGEMLLIQATGAKVWGGGVRDMMFDCAGNADTAVKLDTARANVTERVYVQDCLVSAFEWTSNQGADSEKNVIRDVTLAPSASQRTPRFLRVQAGLNIVSDGVVANWHHSGITNGGVDGINDTTGATTDSSGIGVELIDAPRFVVRDGVCANNQAGATGSFDACVYVQMPDTAAGAPAQSSGRTIIDNIYVEQVGSAPTIDARAVITNNNSATDGRQMTSVNISNVDWSVHGAHDGTIILLDDMDQASAAPNATTTNQLTTISGIRTDTAVDASGATTTLIAAVNDVTINGTSILLSTDNVETMATAGGSGTAPLSDGASGLTMTDVLTEVELDTFAEAQTQIADKTLVNEEDAVTWDAAHTFAAAVTLSPGATGDLCVFDDGSIKCDLDDDGVSETWWVGDYDKNGSPTIDLDLAAAATALCAQSGYDQGHLIVAPLVYDNSTTSGTDLWDLTCNNLTVDLGSAVLDGWETGDTGTGSTIVVSGNNNTIRGGFIANHDSTGQDWTIYTAGTRMGIRIQGNGTKILGTDIKYTRHAGIYVNENSNTLIDSVTMDYIGGYGSTTGNPERYPCVYVFADNNAVTDNVTVSNLQCKRAGGGCVTTRQDSWSVGDVEYNKNVLVSGALCDDTVDGGDVATGSAFTFRGCRECSVLDSKVIGSTAFRTTTVTDSLYWDSTSCGESSECVGAGDPYSCCTDATDTGDGCKESCVDTNRNISLFNIDVSELPATANHHCFKIENYVDGATFGNITCDNAYTESFVFGSPNRHLVADGLHAYDHGQISPGSRCIDFDSVGTWTGLSEEEYPTLKNIKCEVNLGQCVNLDNAMDDITLENFTCINQSNSVSMQMDQATTRFTLLNPRIHQEGTGNDIIAFTGTATDPLIRDAYITGTGGGGAYAVDFTTGGGTGARIEGLRFPTTARPAVNAATATDLTLVDVSCDHTDCVDWTTEQPEMHNVETQEEVYSNLGIEFEPGDVYTDCSAFDTTGGAIYYDDSEGKFKKCQDNTLTDMQFVESCAAGESARQNGTATALECFTAGAASGDVTDVFNCATGDCAEIDVTDGDRLNFAAVNPDTANEGLILPQTTSCTGTPDAGAICYGTTSDELCVYDGGAWDCQTLGAGGFTSFNVDGDNNSPETITDGNEFLVAGGNGITTTASATDTVTVAVTADSINQDELASTITFAPTDNIVLPIEAADQTVDGEIDYDSTEEVIEVGDDGVGTLKFFPVGTFTATNFCTADASLNQIDCATAGSLTDDDLSDDNPTALQNVTTINDGDFCQGNASSGFDCDVTTIDEADLDANVVLDNEASTWASSGTQTFQDPVTLGSGTVGETLTFDDDGGIDGTIAWDETSDVWTLPDNSIVAADIATEVRSMYWQAGSLSADGTGCTDPAEETINSGPKLYVVNCPTDGATSIIYGSTHMPDGWDGGNTIQFTPSTVNKNATPSGTYILTFSAQCRTPGTDAINSTWGTGVTSTVTHDTQYRVEAAATANVTPNGSACAGGDTLFWRAISQNGTTTQEADIVILGVKMEYTTNVGD